MSIKLSEQSSNLFGLSVSYFMATNSPKWVTKTGIASQKEAEQLQYEKDLELVRHRVISWHTQLSYNVRYTFRNPVLCGHLQPILKAIYERADKLSVKNTREKNYQLIDEIRAHLLFGKPQAGTEIGLTRWLHIYALVEAYRHRYLASETVLS